MAAPTLGLEPTSSEPERLGLWRDSRRRFSRNRRALAGVIFVGVVALLAVAAPLLTAFGVLADPLALNYDAINTPPSHAHLLGTDALGRDLLSRAIYGARVSLSIAVLLQVVILVVGGAVGLAAGYGGGRVDNLLMRLTDVMFAFPDLLFVLVIAAVVGPGYWNMFVAVGVVSWPYLARLVRGEVLSIKQRDFIEAARASGTRPSMVVLRHILPNSLGPVIVALAFGVPSAIFLEAFLSFLGVGIRPPTPSWGTMINEGYHAVFAYPYQVLVPAVVISLTTLSFNFIGDGLRDSLDPKMRR